MMLVTIENLLKLPRFGKVTVVAGSQGLHNDIVWTNTVESPDLVEFVQKNELIFTTGINIKDKIELFMIVKNTFEAGAAGIVMNLGPYISEVSQQIIDFGQANHYPVLTMPWNVRIADIAHIICEYIIKNGDIRQKKENSAEIKDVFKGLLTGKKNLEDSAEFLQNYGFSEKHNYGVLVMDVSGNSDEKNNELISKTLNYELGLYNIAPVCFGIGNSIVSVIISLDDIETLKKAVGDAVTKAIGSIISQNSSLKIIAGTGRFYNSLEKARESFYEAETAIKASQYYPLSGVQFYEFGKLDIFALFSGLRTNGDIKEFSGRMIGRLKEYDKMNDSNNIEFLKLYLQEDGSVIRISRRLYMHRNTVMYKIKKIEDILECNLSAAIDKTQLIVAFIIDDIL
jgi:sugar diacid utilization regulator